MDEDFKLPRIFTRSDLAKNAVAVLTEGQAHYFKNVLRKGVGDTIRLFNGREGEWRGHFETLDKKSGTVTLTQQIRQQPEHTRRLHLIFSPIKKDAMDWMVEKAVELGATDFHPVLTQNTEVRKINDERMTQQIFEAAEQCERLEIPVLHPLKKLDILLTAWPPEVPVLACVERSDAPHPSRSSGEAAVLIGPEGGFTKEERTFISARCKTVSLGEAVLRAETAALKAIVLLT